MSKTESSAVSELDAASVKSELDDAASELSAKSELKKARVYTRGGDAGDTSLYDGTRVSKADARIDAVGALDECNTWIGTIEFLFGEIDPNTPDLQRIQQRLLDAGTAVATPATASERKRKRAEFPRGEVEWLEERIDTLDADLPPLANFILPRGPVHIARVTVRRSERVIAQAARVLADAGADPFDPEVLRYINRLSDYLFTLARVFAISRQVPDILYKKE